jgi:DNA-binding response OmpR family regulator
MAWDSAEELCEGMPTMPFAVLLLDLNLPGEDGLSLATRLKRVHPQLRVIMMTTRTTLTDRVVGYESGADLYLPKPVAEEELVAAVQALTRQIVAEQGAGVANQNTALHLDAQAGMLRGPSRAVTVTVREANLLTALATAPNSRLEYWQLMQAMELNLEESGRSTLAVAITRLRAKLLEAGCLPNAIRAVRASGYQLCVPMIISHHASGLSSPVQR